MFREGTGNKFSGKGESRIKMSHCFAGKAWNALVIMIGFLFLLGWFMGNKVFTIEYFEACPKVTLFYY